MNARFACAWPVLSRPPWHMRDGLTDRETDHLITKAPVGIC
jgi:hypothetical protein